ncbi:hypothetical protein LguiB_031389 [Lonicera macranthoides]
MIIDCLSSYIYIDNETFYFVQKREEEDEKLEDHLKHSNIYIDNEALCIGVCIYIHHFLPSKLVKMSSIL